MIRATTITVLALLLVTSSSAQQPAPVAPRGVPITPIPDQHFEDPPGTILVRQGDQVGQGPGSSPRVAVPLLRT